jgi:hypothetical protein
VAGFNAGVQVIRLTGCDAPSYVGSAETPGNANAIAVHAGRVFVADGQGVSILPSQCEHPE